MISGSVSWGVYFFVNQMLSQQVFATFLATLAVTIMATVELLMSPPSMVATTRWRA